jgi:RHS repeat-associated protein
MRTSRSSGGANQTFIINYALTRPTVSIVRQDGADLRYYIYLPDGKLLYSLEASDGSPRFYHFDEAGSTLFLTGDDGSITDSYAVTPYGEQVDHTGLSDNPFTFLGQYGVVQEGATGLYYMGFRYYDSVTARFLTRAPGVEPDLRHPNLYQYATSDSRSAGSRAARLRRRRRAAKGHQAMRKVRRLCATAVVTLLMAPMTGCSADDFFAAIFLSLACAADAFGPDPCGEIRLSNAVSQYWGARNNCHNDGSAACASICPLRSQLLEAAAEQCSNLQEQAQHAVVPSGPRQCNLGLDAQGALADASAIAGCP